MMMRRSNAGLEGVNLSSLLSPFQEAQLGVTLSKAIQHPFYAKHWALLRDAVLSASPASVLVELPPIAKDHLDRDIEPVLQEGDEVVGVSFSSGSTGKIVSRISTMHERWCLEQLGCATTPEDTSERGPSRKSVHLEFVSSWHGVGVSQSLGKRSITLPGSAADGGRIRRTLALMRKPLVSAGVEPYVSTISGGMVGVYSFTRYLQDIGVSPEEFSVKAIGVFGGYLGSRRRKVIETFWRCPVVDSFSVSECRGKALVCPGCGFLSFDPQLLPQVLSIETDLVLDRGHGRLAITELYPFGIAQPLIKYLTGDLVEFIPIGSECCESHRRGLRRIGRIESSAIFEAKGRKTLLLPSQDLYELFDRRGVFREDPELNLKLSENDLGQPWVSVKVSLEQGNPLLTISYRPDDSHIQLADELTALTLSRVRKHALAMSCSLGVKIVPNHATPCPMTKFA